MEFASSAGSAQRVPISARRSDSHVQIFAHLILCLRSKDHAHVSRVFEARESLFVRVSHSIFLAFERSIRDVACRGRSYKKFVMLEKQYDCAG